MRRTAGRRQLATAGAFLAPNLAGFLVFTLVPLAASLALAFTNWDLRLHGRLEDPERLRFVGLANFARLVAEPAFWRYLGNTLFLMLGIPFAIAGSLGAALLLSRDVRLTRAATLACGVVCGAAVALLAVVGAGGTAVLLAATGAAILLGGALGGSVVYRTLFYLPSFTAGVATILLWKNLLNPEVGPVNAALRPVLDGVAAFARDVPNAFRALGLLAFAGALAVMVAACKGIGARIVDREFGNVAVIAALGAAGMLALLGVANVLFQVPAWAADGLTPPGWHLDYDWAKPALMLVGLWGAIGSNNMLLYLAALAGVPRERYEAADLDGASPRARFWNVTWPALAPTTFFIVVMSVIGGLQGGFETARAMTRGGPDGATTTLSYFVYAEGFETGRLGHASAIAWTLFALVLVVTLFNWRFGERYVDDAG